jgi:hypothetical protein
MFLLSDDCLITWGEAGRLVTQTSLDNPVAAASVRRMIVFMFEFTTNSPEFSHQEIDKQIAEFEREFAEHQQDQETR